jgi:hypothetical protein
MVNYQEGKIYEVMNDINDVVYIGSTTTRYLCNRMSDHRDKSKTRPSPFSTAIRQLGKEHFKISLVRVYPCNSKAELEAEEFRTMREYRQRGIQLYNEFIDGKHSDESKERMSGANHKGFHRGSVRFVSRKNYWRFEWWDHNHRGSQCFSVKRFGYNGAHGLALWAQDEKFPTEPIE